MRGYCGFAFRRKGREETRTEGKGGREGRKDVRFEGLLRVCFPQEEKGGNTDGRKGRERRKDVGEGKGGNTDGRKDGRT